MKKWCLRCLLKTGNVKAEETWVGSLFQTWDAMDEKDFEVAIDVFLNGADMVIEKEDRSDQEGVYLGRIWARYKSCWWCSTLKAVVAILKLIRWRTGSQCRPTRLAWCSSRLPRLLCNNSSKGILNQPKASQIWCKKRITIVKPRANYC